ncbi:MAG: hypothetical protein ACM37W_20020 [Actinomycetota bacterium]
MSQKDFHLGTMIDSVSIYYYDYGCHRNTQKTVIKDLIFRKSQPTLRSHELRSISVLSFVPVCPFPFSFPSVVVIDPPPVPCTDS